MRQNAEKHQADYYKCRDSLARAGVPDEPESSHSQNGQKREEKELFHVSKKNLGMMKILNRAIENAKTRKMFGILMLKHLI